MKNCFKGFTLAEIMVVLVVIGVLAGILVPVANNARPDEKVMKFKKANATLANVIHELVTSDKYYAEGDLSLMPDGTDVSSPTYFCQTIADLLTTKSVNCSTVNTGQYNGHVDNCEDADTHTLQYAKSQLDTLCKTHQSTIGAEIVTVDNIKYFQSNPAYHFAINWGSAFPSFNTTTLRLYYHTCNNFYRNYKAFCIDIDDIGKGEDPFGYGIRVDGKILTGARADEWLEKGFQKGKNDN